VAVVEDLVLVDLAQVISLKLYSGLLYYLEAVVVVVGVMVVDLAVVVAASEDLVVVVLAVVVPAEVGKIFIKKSVSK
jgi:hypothetical protein